MQANQSRGRADAVANNPQPLEESLSAFQYRPLDPDRDGIRLVVIEPNEDREALICCKLRHVTFAEKPKYEALSYMWGDESTREGIVVDGKEFFVGILLLGALQDLRYGTTERVVWIDAICIDQKNIPERNRQLSIMPHIYQRAKCVLVSLRYLVPGHPTPGHHKKSKETRGWKQTWSLPYNLIDFWSSQDQRAEVTRQLCDADYWKRVWIIQECSLARNLKLIGGKSGIGDINWETFIREVRSNPNIQNSLNNSVPLRLQKQIEQKYTDGHKLQTLLESHQDALCEDPRDKVYGFIGLATDTLDGFPMDYGKTLFEVWKDTVMFKNADTESSRHDIMKFGKLVQKILGGKSIATEEEVLQDISVRLGQGIRMVNKDKPSVTTLSIPGRLIGRINCLGPTSYEIISDLKQTAVWRSCINKYLPESQRASAREQSDLFLEALEEMEDEELRIVIDYTHRKSSFISWEIGEEPASITMLKGDCLNDVADTWTDGPSGVPRLVLLAGTKDYKGPSSKLGLAPSSTRPGDFVCQIHGLEKAVVVRHDPGEELLILVGTAALPQNRHKARARQERDDKSSSEFETAYFNSIPDDEVLDLFMDVAIAYQLLN